MTQKIIESKCYIVMVSSGETRVFVLAKKNYDKFKKVFAMNNTLSINEDTSQLYLLTQCLGYYSYHQLFWLVLNSFWFYSREQKSEVSGTIYALSRKFREKCKTVPLHMKFVENVEIKI